MSTWVHVIYTGIVSFFPGAGDLWMIVPDASRNASHAHAAHLIVEKDAIVSVAGLKEIQPNPHRPLSIYELGGYNIDFHFATRTQTEVHPRCILPLPKGCPEQLANCGKPHADYYSVHDPEVAAWAQLFEGTLEAIYVDARAEWQFVTAPNGKRVDVGRLAQEVCHSFQIAGDKVVLTFDASPSHANDDGAEDARLELKSIKAGEAIEVRIGNTLPNEILLAVPLSSTPKADRHVALYYPLSHLNVTHGQRPWLDPISGADRCTANSTHPSHRLSGDAMAELLASNRAMTSSDGANRRGLAEERRVGGSNCPPGLWQP